MTRHELIEHFAKRAENDGNFAIAWAILQLAEAQTHTAKALGPLGHSDLNAVEIANGLRSVASALTPIDGIASAIERRG
ncbi:hypothetical protein VQ042_18060 [Aurantimonas sp. A2-1-M11]|uniref:hypothetical protein n=1 Tax=Aurantimonas sp. A2-1-M11 TaxID=3113712 RepID=UPI002F934C08